MRSKRQNFYIILILGILTALSPFSIDMYLPAFPEIAEDLKTPASEVALSLSGYFIGLALGQILYGPLLDRFGRKKPLYYGIALYVLASVGCFFSSTINELIIFRFLQAIGGCAANVASVAMVRDLFSIKESSKVFSLLVLILGASPLLAPTIGGYVSSTLGWRSVFVILAGIAVLMGIISALYLPESHVADVSVSLDPLAIVRQYSNVLFDPRFFTYTISGAVAFSGLFVYVSGSPILFMEIFRVSPEIYSWIFAFLSIGFIGASQMNILLIRKFSNTRILKTALFFQVLATSLFFAGSIQGWFGLWETVAFFFVLLSLVGLLNPNASALALAPFSKNAGSASALMGSLQMGIGAVASTGVGLFSAHTSLPLASIFFSSSLLAFAILFLGRRRIVDEVVSEENTQVVLH